MADEITVVWLADLAQAQPASDTDQFAVCQNPDGCDATTPLVRLTLAELRDYLAANAAPPPVFNGPDVLSAMLGVDCHATDPTTNHSYRKYPYGQNCVVTDVILCNASGPISGPTFTVRSSTGEVLVNAAAVTLAKAPDVTNGDGGAVQRISNINQACVADQFYCVVANPAAAGVTCDLYILGFPMQPVQP